MALAILDLIDSGHGNVRFNIDTGTNRYWRLKAGRSVRRSNGVDWVDDVFLSTPIRASESGGSLLNSSKKVSVPAQEFLKGNTGRRQPNGSRVYVQLFSFKNADGKSPAFSDVVRLFTASGVLEEVPADFALPFSVQAMSVAEPFRSPRRIPCTSSRELYARQASLEDLLGGIVKAAAPFVMNLLGGAQAAPQQSPQAPGTGGAPAPNGGAGAQGDVLIRLLTSVLGNLAGLSPTVSRQQSVLRTNGHGNRFTDPQNSQFSRPFIFGIDDALLASLVGPVVQVLPQLMNAANQNRIQLKQANNKLVTDLVSDVNRRMLLEQLLQAQRQPPPAGQPAGGVDLGQLIQLLQQAPAAPAPAVTAQPAPPPAAPAVTPPAVTDQPAPPPPSQTQSMPQGMSRTAVVSFVTSEPIAWNGTTKVLFAQNQALQLKVKLVVGEPVPKAPLPRAIVKFTFKDTATQSVCLEKVFKQKDLPANTEMTFAFSQDEAARLPANKLLSVFSEVRWLSEKTKKEFKALGSQEIVVVGKYVLKEQGPGVSEEQELTDMKRFRPFWNRIWETQSLDAVSQRGHDKKHLWELNASVKYSVILSASHDSNGLMDTKILKARTDPESLSARTEGRIKAGIELSISELNKLISLWNGGSPLDADRINALKTEAFASNNAGEFIQNFKLKGKAADRGMVWVVPVFKLFELTLSAVSHVDGTGQVTAMSEEKARFPLPVSARVIGLKSKQ